MKEFIIAMWMLFNLFIIITDVKERKVRHFLRAFGIALAAISAYYGFTIYLFEFALCSLVAIVLFYWRISEENGQKVLGGGDTVPLLNALIFPEMMWVFAGSMIFSYILKGAFKLLGKEKNEAPLAAMMSAIALIIYAGYIIVLVKP